MPGQDSFARIGLLPLLAAFLLFSVDLHASAASEDHSTADHAAHVEGDEHKATQTGVGRDHGHGEDVSEILMHHVQDSHEWEVVPGLLKLNLTPGFIRESLPSARTQHGLMIMFVVLIVGGLFVFACRNHGLKARGLANVLELLILFVRDEIVYPTMGEERGEKWLPFFLTLFVFLLGANYIGLIPLFRTPTGNFNVTSALALLILAVILIGGIVQLGLVHFFRNMTPDGAPFPIGPFVCFLEFMGIFIKSIVLSLRLFANMLAGHLVILALLSLIFILSPYFAAISLPLAVFVYVLELLVALIQAVVFTLLSCMFVSMATSAH